jgi:DNA repair exonuclease SbcCD ATPase subunit
MTTLINLLVIRLTVGITEIIIFQLGAIVLGFAIHLFLTSRKNTRLQMQQPLDSAAAQEADEWKLKYFNDTEDLEKRIQKLQHELKLSKDNEQFLAIEIDSVRQERQELLESQAEITSPAKQTTDYLERLQEAQLSMIQNNQRVHQLLSQIEQLKQMEQKQQELLQANDVLSKQMGDMRLQLMEKENDIRTLRQQSRLGEEMQQRLEKVYSDYNGLLDKMHKLESHVSTSQKEGISYAELQDSYFKVTKELDEFKLKYLSLLEDNQRTTRMLAELEDKHRESNFQRMQLQKKVTYLEELNLDLQQVAEHHNKLHSQMKRISEIEQLLAKATQLSSPDKADPSL